MLTNAQLEVATCAAKLRFARLRKKYPQMKAYLVMALSGEQTAIDSSPAAILKNLPAMVIASPHKARALEPQFRLEVVEWKLKRDQENKDLQNRKKELTERLVELGNGFHYDENTRIELRFEILTGTPLDIELIGNLQQDDLVDRDLTPQTKASIRIVLGTLAQFLAEDQTRTTQKG